MRLVKELQDIIDKLPEDHFQCRSKAAYLVFLEQLCKLLNFLFYEDNKTAKND